MSKPTEPNDATPLTNQESLYFGPFELETETEELRRAGRIVALRPLPTRALVALVSRPDRLTTREHLRHALWSDSVLGWDQALNQCIRQLRKSLGDRSDDPVYIETVHGRGYRFIAEVTESPTDAGQGRGFGSTQSSRYRPFIAGFGTALASVGLLVAICSFLSLS